MIVCIDLDPLFEGEFVRFLHPVLFGRKSLCAAHTLGLGVMLHLLGGGGGGIYINYLEFFFMRDLS